jgi:hypothetical protein
VKGQVRDAERNLRSYFRVAIIRAVSKARTDPARWCAGRSNKYWLIPVVLPKSKGHRSERTSCQSSLSNVCPLLFCVFVCVSVRVSVANFYKDRTRKFDTNEQLHIGQPRSPRYNPEECRIYWSLSSHVKGSNQTSSAAEPSQRRPHSTPSCSRRSVPFVSEKVAPGSDGRCKGY